MVKVLSSILATMILVGCSNLSTHLSSHEHQLVPFRFEDVEFIEYETPEIRRQVQAFAEMNADGAPWGGWYCAHSNYRQPEKSIETTRFRIVSVTEEYVPITGERKSVLFHVKMSSID